MYRAVVISAVLPNLWQPPSFRYLDSTYYSGPPIRIELTLTGSIMTHEELTQKVAWRDLRTLSVKEMLIENNLTIPWFLASMALAYYEYYLLALPFSAFFFLT